MAPELGVSADPSVVGVGIELGSPDLIELHSANVGADASLCDASSRVRVNRFLSKYQGWDRSDWDWSQQWDCHWNDAQWEQWQDPAAWSKTRQPSKDASQSVGRKKNGHCFQGPAGNSLPPRSQRGRSCSPQPTSDEKLQTGCLSGKWRESKHIFSQKADVGAGAAPPPVRVKAEMAIPQNLVGWLIGRAGQSIQQIRDQSGAAVFLDQHTKEQGYSTFRITGCERSVAEAKSFVEEKLWDAQCVVPTDIGSPAGGEPRGMSEDQYGNAAHWGASAGSGVVPIKIIRAVLMALLGKWHGVSIDGVSQFYDIAIGLMSNGAQLACWASTGSERPIRYEGGDVMLGGGCDSLYLDAISERQVTWVHERSPEVQSRWTRASPGGGGGGGLQMWTKGANTSVEPQVRFDVNAEEDFPLLTSPVDPAAKQEKRIGGCTAWAKPCVFWKDTDNRPHACDDHGSELVRGTPLFQ